MCVCMYVCMCVSGVGAIKAALPLRPFLTFCASALTSKGNIILN
jgi:hypothetical protein